MKIIIAGCGNIGKTLAAELSEEGHDLIMIDQNLDRLISLSDEIDALAVHGDACDIDVLRRAEVDSADLLIAVTRHDEENLLCCMMAKNLGNCRTIARVSKPVYHKDAAYLQREFGLAMIINPAYDCARAIAGILRFPEVSRIDTFETGNINLFHTYIGAHSPLADQSVIDVDQRYGTNSLFCTVAREGKVYIPGANFILRSGDEVSIAASRGDMRRFFRRVGVKSKGVREVIVVGGGRTGIYLTRELLEDDYKVTIIEKDRAKADWLAEHFGQATVICGDASDEKLLQEENLATIQGFAAVTNFDEENVLLSLYARRHSSAKVVTRIHRLNFRDTVQSLPLDTIVNPQMLMANRILLYVRSQENKRGSTMLSLYKLNNGAAEATEFRISDRFPYVGVPLKELPLKANILIVGIVHGANSIIPNGDSVIQAGDSVIVVAQKARISSFDDAFIK